MRKRLFDIFFSSIAFVILLPVLLIIGILIIIDSKGGIFYTQIRVGKNNRDFNLLKFRTMRKNSDKKGLLTVGGKDNRITKIGYYLRKLKLDELPQLINILKGDMSIVGPRPEVRKYVQLYTKEQKQVLKVKPGLTDFASIQYFNENEILGKSKDPEKTYITEIMPHKIKLNLKYINQPGLKTDCKIILKTLKLIIKKLTH